MGKYQAYPEYKDSGVEWLGEVPEGWEISSIKRICYVNDGNHGEEYPKDTDYTDSDNGVPFIRGGNLDGFRVVARDMVYITKTKNDSMRKGRLQCGDILFVNRGDIGKLALVSEDYSGANLNSQIAYLRCIGCKVSNTFLLYYLASDYVSNLLKSAKMGSVLIQFPINNILEIKVPLPNFSEQQKIAAFLDHETAKIDALIEKQQQLIQLLKEKRQAVISHAVTKGLNPNAPMKDSGIEWLGEVPAHWDVKRLKNVAEIIDCRNKTPDYIDDGEYLVVRTTNVKNQRLNFEGALYTDKKNFDIWTARGIPPPGSILFTREAPAGEVCLVPDEIKLCMGQRMMNFITHSQDYQTYLFNFLMSDYLGHYIRGVSHGSTVSHLRVEQVENIPVLVPSPDELIGISEAVARIKNSFLALIEKSDAAIDLLTERRTALISAAVTGKIDVRHFSEPATR